MSLTIESSKGKNYLVKQVTEADKSVYASKNYDLSYTWKIINANVSLLSNHNYLVDTSISQITVSLPPGPKIGDKINIVDLKGTFSINNCIVLRNGNKIMGLNGDLSLIIDNQSIELLYSTSESGWRITKKIT